MTEQASNLVEELIILDHHLDPADFEVALLYLAKQIKAFPGSIIAYQLFGSGAIGSFATIDVQSPRVLENIRLVSSPADPSVTLSEAASADPNTLSVGGTSQPIEVTRNTLDPIFISLSFRLLSKNTRLKMITAFLGSVPYNTTTSANQDRAEAIDKLITKDADPTEAKQQVRFVMSAITRELPVTDGKKLGMLLAKIGVVLDFDDF